MAKCTVNSRQVERVAPVKWLVGAMALIGRAPEVWAVLSIILYVVLWITGPSVFLSRTFVLGLVFMGMSIAAAVDESSGHWSWQEIMEVARRDYPQAILAALSVAVIQFLLSSLWPLISLNWAPLTKEFFNPEYAWWNTGSRSDSHFFPTALSFFFTWLIVLGNIWLVYPLMSMARYGVREACRKNIDAMGKNLSVFSSVVVGTSVLSSTVIVLAPVIIPLLYVLIAIFSYVAYKDLFMEEAESEALGLC